MDPALRINSFLGHLWLSVVSFEYRVASVKNLTSWFRLSMLIDIIRSIVHIGDIDKFDFDSWERSANMSSFRV
jgi:hypothetical protein